ncbi:MAG: hypothetical protein R3C53_24650 [Pirellulaceae bacterium]
MELSLSRAEFIEFGLRYMRLPNQRDARGRTLLHIYASTRSVRRVALADIALMVRLGIDINAFDRDGLTAVRLNIRNIDNYSHHEITSISIVVSYYRSVGADLMVAAQDGKTLLDDLQTILTEDGNSAKLLGTVIDQLKTTSSSQIHDDREATHTNLDPKLWWFGISNSFALAENREAAFAFEGLVGHPLMLEHKVRSIETLMESNLDLDARGIAGITFLWVTFNAGKVGNYELSLRNGASPDLRLTEELWPYYVRHNVGPPELTPASFCPRAQETVLMAACLNAFRREQFVLPALAQTREPGQLDVQGRNLLHRLLYYPLGEEGNSLAKSLIDAGVETNLRSLGGTTPCHIAVARNPQLIPLLIEAGADPLLPDRYGRSVADLLQIAIEDDWPEQRAYRETLQQLVRIQLESSQIKELEQKASADPAK